MTLRMESLVPDEEVFGNHVTFSGYVKKEQRFLDIAGHKNAGGSSRSGPSTV